jgi:hypothetical protein
MEGHALKMPAAGYGAHQMTKRIAIIQGHPDAAGNHLLNAMANAYAEAAIAAEHQVRRIEVAALDFPLLRTLLDFEELVKPEPMAPAALTGNSYETRIKRIRGWIANPAFHEPLLTRSAAPRWDRAGPPCARGSSRRRCQRLPRTGNLRRWRPAISAPASRRKRKRQENVPCQ